MTGRLEGGRDEVGRVEVVEGEEWVGDMWRGRDGTRLLQRSMLKRGSDENLSAFIYLHSIRLPFMQTFICMYIYIFSMYIRICTNSTCVVNGICITHFMGYFSPGSLPRWNSFGCAV